MNTTDTVQRSITEYWNRYARDYDAHQLDRQRQPGVIETWSRVWCAGLPAAPARILDVATGSGNVALLLAELGYRVTGIDLAEDMLVEALKKCRGAHAPAFELADATDPPFDPATFDAITARYALWTVPDPADTFARWRRLLRPGGVLVAVDSPWFPTGIPAETTTARERDFQAAYRAEVLARLPLAEAPDIQDTAGALKQAGFGDVTVDELPEVLDLDHRLGVAPGHQPRMQYRIRATADG